MRLTKSDEFNLRHFYIQFSMTRLKKVGAEEENFMADILFYFQRKQSFNLAMAFDV